MICYSWMLLIQAHLDHLGQRESEKTAGIGHRISRISRIRQLTASDVETLAAALPHYVVLQSLAVSPLELNEKAAKSLMAKCFKHVRIIGLPVLATYW